MLVLQEENNAKKAEDIRRYVVFISIEFGSIEMVQVYAMEKGQIFFRLLIMEPKAVRRCFDFAQHDMQHRIHIMLVFQHL
jgi:hypothetical protein